MDVRIVRIVRKVYRWIVLYSADPLHMHIQYLPQFLTLGSFLVLLLKAYLKDMLLRDMAQLSSRLHPNNNVAFFWIF